MPHWIAHLKQSSEGSAFEELANHKVVLRLLQLGTKPAFNHVQRACNPQFAYLATEYSVQAMSSHFSRLYTKKKNEHG